MGKILCDVSTIDENGNLVLAPVENSKAPEATKIMNATRKVLDYLCTNGLMEKVASAYGEMQENGNTVRLFVVDTDELKQFDTELAENVKEYNDATRYKNMENIQGGFFDGGITVSQPMTTYREDDGGIGRSWEDVLVQNLTTAEANEVDVVKEKYGPLQASILALKINTGEIKATKYGKKGTVDD